jgi:hypothetical protein
METDEMSETIGKRLAIDPKDPWTVNVAKALHGKEWSRTFGGARVFLEWEGMLQVRQMLEEYLCDGVLARLHQYRVEDDSGFKRFVQQQEAAARRYSRQRELINREIESEKVRRLQRNEELCLAEENRLKNRFAAVRKECDRVWNEFVNRVQEAANNCDADFFRELAEVMEFWRRTRGKPAHPLDYYLLQCVGWGKWVTRDGKRCRGTAGPRNWTLHEICVALKRHQGDRRDFRREIERRCKMYGIEPKKEKPDWHYARTARVK